MGLSKVQKFATEGDQKPGVGRLSSIFQNDSVGCSTLAEDYIKGQGAHGLRQGGARGGSGPPWDFQCHSINAPIVPYNEENVIYQSLNEFKMIGQYNLLA